MTKYCLVNEMTAEKCDYTKDSKTREAEEREIKTTQHKTRKDKRYQNCIFTKSNNFSGHCGKVCSLRKNIPDLDFRLGFYLSKQLRVNALST